MSPSLENDESHLISRSIMGPFNKNAIDPNLIKLERFSYFKETPHSRDYSYFLLSKLNCRLLYQNAYMTFL